MTLTDRIPWPLTPLTRAAPRYLLIRRGQSRVRVLLPSSAGRPATLYLDGSAQAPDAGLLRDALAATRAATHDHQVVVTQALTPAQAQGFLDYGGSVIQQLTVLERGRPASSSSGRRRREPKPGEPKPGEPKPGEPLVRRARRHDLGVVEWIDLRSFGVDWCFDRAALIDACRVTPSSRFRVALNQRHDVVGFAISGQSRHNGFLQRLAVDPGEQGAGIGRTLVADALSWFDRADCRVVTVNTRPDNARAMRLYRSSGFTVTGPGLIQVDIGDLE